jgi:hypothetical protein
MGNTYKECPFLPSLEKDNKVSAINFLINVKRRELTPLPFLNLEF